MYAGIVRSFAGCRRLGNSSDGIISIGSLEVVSSSVGDSTGSATVGLARILISASRSLAVKLRPR